MKLQSLRWFVQVGSSKLCLHCTVIAHIAVRLVTEEAKDSVIHGWMHNICV